MLRRYRFELILILLYAQWLQPVFPLLFIPRPHFAASTSFSLK